MKNFFNSLKTTITTGFFFLVPLVLLAMIIEKAFNLSLKVVTPVAKMFPRVNIAGLGLQELISFVLIILICILAGLFARLEAVKKMISNLESNVLGFIPGYTFMKRMGENLVGFEGSQDMPVVLVQVGEGDAWQLAFQIEQINNEIYTVFIPDSPSPWSGGLFHIPKERMRPVAISQKDALQCIRNIGVGSAALLKGKI